MKRVALVLVVGVFGALILFGGPSATALPDAPLQLDNCPGRPQFTIDQNLPDEAGFRTLGREEDGLALFYAAADGSLGIQTDPTYDDFGSLGSIVYDQRGNTYTTSVPFIDVLKNPAAQRNSIMIVDSSTGMLREFTSLPIEHSDADGSQPFGVVGITYDCTLNSLWVGTLSGSTASEAMGSIWLVDIATETAVEVLRGIDALSLATASAGGERYLVIGDARAPQLLVGRISGTSLQTPTTLARIEGQGLYLDAKAQEIEQLGPSGLQVTTYPFDYSLRATSDDITETLQLSFDELSGRYE